MIIKRTYYYYVSTQPNLEKQIIKPTIPDNFLTRGRFIDWKTKRIRLYRTIEDAISGLYLGENFRKGTKIYVYRAVGINKDYLHGPQDITKVPYALVLPEYWYTSSLRLESLGEIKLEKKGEEIFKYGPRQTVGKIYRWKWYEERSYSILSDVYHSGLKRTYKKNVGRLRRKVGDRLSKSIWKDINTAATSLENLDKINQGFRPETNNNLRQVAKRRGIGVVVEPSLVKNEGYMSSTENLISTLTQDRANHTDLINRLKNDSKSGISNQVIIGEENVPVIAHEIGHAISKSKNPKRFNRSQVARDIISEPKGEILFGSRISLLGNNKRRNILKKAWKGGILSARAYPEELRANKYGLKLIKKSGATKEEIDTAKNIYNYNKNFYKTDWIYPKEILREGIQNKRYKIIKNPDGSIVKQELSTSYLDDIDRLIKRGKIRRGEYGNDS